MGVLTLLTPTYLLRGKDLEQNGFNKWPPCILYTVIKVQSGICISPSDAQPTFRVYLTPHPDGARDWKAHGTSLLQELTQGTFWGPGSAPSPWAVQVAKQQ